MMYKLNVNVHTHHTLVVTKLSSRPEVSDGIHAINNINIFTIKIQTLSLFLLLLFDKSSSSPLLHDPVELVIGWHMHCILNRHGKNIMVDHLQGFLEFSCRLQRSEGLTNTNLEWTQTAGVTTPLFFLLTASNFYFENLF